MKTDRALNMLGLAARARKLVSGEFSTEKAVKTGTIISTFFAIIISGGCYFLGGFGRLFDCPAIYNPEDRKSVV